MGVGQLGTTTSKSKGFQLSRSPPSNHPLFNSPPQLLIHIVISHIGLLVLVAHLVP